MEEDEWTMESDEMIDVRAIYFVVGGVEGSSRVKESKLRKLFILGDELGRGNFAVVVRAVRRPTGRPAPPPPVKGQMGPVAVPGRPDETLPILAIKAINAAKVHNLSEVEAEIRIMQMMRHPSVVDFLVC